MHQSHPPPVLSTTKRTPSCYTAIPPTQKKSHTTTKPSPHPSALPSLSSILPHAADPPIRHHCPAPPDPSRVQAPRHRLDSFLPSLLGNLQHRPPPLPPRPAVASHAPLIFPAGGCIKLASPRPWRHPVDPHLPVAGVHGPKSGIGFLDLVSGLVGAPPPLGPSDSCRRRRPSSMGTGLGREGPASSSLLTVSSPKIGLWVPPPTSMPACGWRWRRSSDGRPVKSCRGGSPCVFFFFLFF
jgi:hypothetical protein